MERTTREWPENTARVFATRYNQMQRTKQKISFAGIATLICGSTAFVRNPKRLGTLDL
ncbi:MAG TPA: hypothetical protein VEF35_03550 [Candidatus Bathyarchaeia archaeon]|nr:hypothetical protein [Candidatus Bathyarchaeia archaeon]